MESPLERKLVWTEKQLEQLRTENAALKEQVAHWESQYNQISFVLDSTERDKEALEETIAQQAAVIEQMREALRHYAYRAGQDWQIAREALALQPSPEILQARDERIAEACAKVVEEYVENTTADLLRSGEWRKHV